MHKNKNAKEKKALLSIIKKKIKAKKIYKVTYLLKN